MATGTEKMLKKLRIDRDESIGDMAARLGISPSYLSAVERGKRAIPKGMLANLRRLYGVPASDLQLMVEEEAELSFRVEIELTAEESKALNALALRELGEERSGGYDRRRERLREKRAEILGRLARKAVRKGS